MNRVLISLLLIAASLTIDVREPAWSAATALDAGVADCSDTTASLAYWRPIRATVTDDDVPADELALQLVPCLGSPNSELRDRIGYEFYTFWLRSNRLSDDTRKTLLSALSERISVLPGPDLSDAVFSRSFSALILSEVMRADARNPFMSTSDRQALLKLAVQALAAENDYRGLDPYVGWIHPVAHQSDLLWRYALHPETSREQAQLMLDVIRNKVAITDTSYHFNEGDRMARVVSTAVANDLVDADLLVGWLSTFESPRSMEVWTDAFTSPRGMAELHNSKQFIRALSDQLESVEIEASIINALQKLGDLFSQLV